MTPPGWKWSFPARVRSVIDCDTLSCAVDCGWDIWHNIKLRVANLDCPEANTPEGNAATLYALTLLGGLPYVIVHTEFDRSFARYVARVELPSGEDYADLVVAAGHGVKRPA